MCAIIGVLGKSLPSQEKFIQARDTMTHRGPDDAGVYYAPHEGVALGHRRLSIIDLSEAGRQPLFSSDGGLALVFNGEIYNFKDLREQLKDFYQFKSQTDSEVILAAYAKWGRDCLSRLQGMFAFAIWDKNKKELFIARDRLGIKPLYWSTHDGNFYFSSEIKGILKSANIPRKLNRQSLLDYLSYRYPLGEKTFFEGIFSLLSGHFVIVSRSGAFEIKKYWELPVVQNKKDPGEKEALEMTEKLLSETVKSHMVSDVPVGAYLSGGVDSSALVAFMSAHSAYPVKTFSVGFNEEGFNEFSAARHVADFLKTDHREIIVSANDYTKLLPEVIRFKDAPLHVPNEAALYALSKELKKHITVVLSGEGADELFGGYGRLIRSGYDLERMQSGEASRSGELLSNIIQKYGDRFYQELVHHFLAQYPYMKPDKTRELLNSEIFRLDEKDILNREFFEDHFRKLFSLHPSEQYLHVLQGLHLLGILHRLDTSAMAASVEARVPYVDHRVVEAVSALPLAYKLSWKSKEDEERSRLLNSDQISDVHDTTKYLLRKIAEKYLPREIAHRKKFSFLVPLDRWFNDDLNQYTKDLLLSDSARSRSLFNEKTLQSWLSTRVDNKDFRSASHGRDIWAIVNLELWMREYGVEV